MIVALFPNEEKKDSFKIASEVTAFFKKKGIEVVAEAEKAPKIGAKPISSFENKKIDFLIAIGGDGTLLSLSQKYCKSSSPIVGINLGQLGFMADIPKNEIYPCLEELLAGKYRIENRIMIEGIASNNQKILASNDISIHRGDNPRLIELEVEIDGSYVNTFLADGIIISTPNGSTAYSLAAGGPIIDPKMEAVVITPICPHTISNRPIVLSDSVAIKIKYLSPGVCKVGADGLSFLDLKQREDIVITKGEYNFKLVKLERHNYFAILRAKLAWSGKMQLI